MIPSSVTSIGNSAFHKCTSLVEITIPSSVTSIGNFAFNGCSSLLVMVIPASVNSIGNSAFNKCSLIQVKILSPAISFGGDVFAGNPLLDQIEIQQSLEFEAEKIGLPSSVHIVKF